MLCMKKPGTVLIVWYVILNRGGALCYKSNLMARFGVPQTLFVTTTTCSDIRS